MIFISLLDYENTSTTIDHRILHGCALFHRRSTGSGPESGSPTPATMKAIVYHDYGSPDVLRLEEIAKPVPNDNQVLIKVRAASVNPLDWHYIEARPTSFAC